MKSKRSVFAGLALVLAVVCGSVFGEPHLVAVRVTVDSQMDGESADKALDGDPNTFWHSRYGDGETKHPHEMVVDLGAAFEISGFSYLPRPGGGNGTIKDYEFYISDNPNNFGQPVSKGTWAYDGSEKSVTFSKRKARYVKLRAMSEGNGTAWTSVAELRLHSDGLEFTTKGGMPPELFDPNRPRRAGTLTAKVTVNSETIGGEGYRAIDGSRDTVWRTNWDLKHDRHAHEITLDLGEELMIEGFIYTPRKGGGNGSIKDYEFHVGKDPGNFGSPVAKGTFDERDSDKKVTLEKKVWGRYVKLRALSEIHGNPWASIAELRILSEDLQFRPGPADEKQEESRLEMTYRGHRPPGDSLHDVLDMTLRTLALVEKAGPQSKLAAELKNLEKQVGQNSNNRGLLDQLRRLRRKIILSHPVLNFSKLLINKRPPPGYSHMCDQYLGRHSRPGPGLAVVENWKDNPRVRHLLEDKLPVGSTLHPDLSYDGRKVLFSFCDHTQEDTKQRRFLIFEATADGRSVRQLTGTPEDPMEGWEGRKTVLIEDFDPCYLPDGGFAFMTTRNQSFGRCHGGRYVPAYLLFRANGDGSGIRQLSFGEANEWDPSVMHDGRIIYTRWDYINRHDTRFQSLWTTAPDGTGTAHFYGNYSSSPCMTAEARAIPGSHKIVCTATAHHGYTSGATIVIDPHKGQDGPEPLGRITPEMRFPEAGDRYSGGASGAFATPWPINEDLYLAAGMYGNLVGQGGVQDVNAYAIYLIDSAGGLELIYRDPKMSCFAPIPIQARPKPPALTSRIVKSENPENEKQAMGTFYLQDVYQSTQSIEPGSIKHLRINRIYGQPNNGKPQLSLANNEIIKGIVGTVPVNRDGSAAFRAPACVPLQLQALDQNGMAVMTMRSLIYLQPGEVASCVGCHEPRAVTPTRPASAAGRRVYDPAPPAGPQYPGGFSYARSMQPVLDRYCIECHGLKKTDAGLNLLGKRDGGYSISHNQLTGRKEMVKIAYRNQETTYSTPKEYYAHAGRLANYLLEEHTNRVKMDRESFQRIVDWLDLNAQFFGDYSRNRAEDRSIVGEGEKALREYIEKRFGSDLARQPIEALVNVAMPSESRILKAPLSTRGGGWGQVSRGGFNGTGDAGYRELQQLVEACVRPHDAVDVAGTCGRERCVCGTCWTRRIRDAILNPPVDRGFEAFRNERSNTAKDVSKENWKLVRADSEETVAANCAATNAFDDNRDTYWHTRLRDDRAAHPHEIVIDLGATYNVRGFRYMPRRGLGDIRDCEFFVGNDPGAFAKPVAQGYFSNRRDEQTVLFEAKQGRYVMLRALSEVDNSAYTSIRELAVLEELKADEQVTLAK